MEEIRKEAITLRYKKLEPWARAPERAHEDDAGLDIWGRVEGFRFNSNGSAVVAFRTGLALEIPEGWVGVLKTRSGHAFHTGCNVIAGVIDAGYRGEVSVIVQVPDLQAFTKAYGNETDTVLKVAQLLILPVPKVKLVAVDVLSKTARGVNGFGSTDKEASK